MAIAELLTVAVLAKLFAGTDAGTKPPDAPPPPPPPPPGGGPGAKLGDTIAGLIGTGISLGTTIAGLVGGGGAAAAGAKTAVVVTGGGSGAAGGTKGLTGAALVAGTVIAVAIAFVWVTLLGAIGVGMLAAAGARAARAQLGAKGVRDYFAQILHEKENDYAKLMIEALNTPSTPVGYNQIWGGLPPYNYWELTSVQGLSDEKMVAIGTVARFLAVEWARGLNSSVLSYFMKDFGYSSAQVAANGDAMESAEFAKMVAAHYQTGPAFFRRAATWGDAWLLVPPDVSAQVRFKGRIDAMTYVQFVLAAGTAFGQSITQEDVSAAAAAVPPGNNKVAYLNRVFAFGHEQKAAVLFDNEALIAWMPLLGNGAVPALLSYATKDGIVDSMTGAGVGAQGPGT